MTPRRRARLHPLALTALLLVAGCAGLPQGGAPAATAPTTATAPAGPASAPGARPPAPPAAAVPGQPQPFATVIKDARRVDGGLLTVWHKDEKFWFELRPEDFGKPFFFGPKISQGIGEAGLFGGTMFGAWGRTGRAQMVEFRRVHNQVQLLALNTEFDAPDKTPEGRAVRAGFSPSLLASAAVASQPHPDRKSVLVEANGMLLSDLLALGTRLQQAYRQNYALDRANSAILRVRGKPGELVFEVQAHYAAAAIAQAQPGAPAGAVPPSVPRSVPDARSLFLGLHYAFAALPQQPMRPRRADARVGYFSTNVASFADDLARSPQQRFVNRWRLEKKDPSAPLSEPVRPIVFWLDRTIPVKYRDALARGVTAWNAAFERIGFKDAVVAKVQPDDADFDTLDIGVASVRWMINSQPSFGAIGPSQVDPRSGEILDADIGFDSLSSRGLRALRAQVLAVQAQTDWPALMQLPEAAAAAAPGDFAARLRLPGVACQDAQFAAEQLVYALDVLEARGELDPDGPEAEAFVLDYLTGVAMHEVGHTLGLRHNFRSSRAYSLAQLKDPDFVRANGLAGSVMEYPPIHLAAPGDKPVPAFRSALGPYDFWAIEYAYKPIAPEQEEAELLRIAGRSAEPLLAYATDEDNSLGVDSEALWFDLGNDPVAHARDRVAIARDLIGRQLTRELKAGTDWNALRRSVTWAIREMGRSGGIVARQIGGVRTLRDHPGSGRDPLVPVDAEVQRAALEELSRHYFSADALQLPPALQRRLAPDFLERTDALIAGSSDVGTDFSPAGMLLDMQRALLAQLMSDAVAQRILDAEGKVDEPARAFRLSELYERLARDIWSELDARSGDIAGVRRELQREHASRLAASLLRPAGQGRADARSLMRVQAQGLLPRLESAQRRAGLSAEARAHLGEVAEQLRQALQARMNRPV
ncbi:MAG: zinc-dependent metalloprotease [Rubrivivax sp.]